jgi:Zn finger protein HypA/HybF involved in hydrogenase expression
MQSFCFEIKSTCKSCGNPISINAFENEIFCESCNNKNEISTGNWESIVADNIKEAKDFKEGEGQNSKTFAGDFEFSLMYGKQKARCTKCKTTIPEETYESLKENSYTCAKCSNIISVRKPGEFILKLVPSARFIVGEDVNQFNTGIKGVKKPDDVKPVLFNCPSCAANLEVDGSARMITCKSCSSKIYLPDELWHELHPVKTVSRWYVLTDGAQINEMTMPEWYYLSDVAADKDGNIYMAGADDDEYQFMLWSISPDLKIRWMRNDFKYEYDYTGITVTQDNKVLLWNKNKRSLKIFSSKDGSDLPGIKGEDATGDNPYPFNLKECTSLISDSDNTLLAIIKNTFIRFYDDGTRAPVWKVVSQKGEKPGFFSRLFGGGNTKVKISSDDWAPHGKEIGSMPKRVDGDYTTMNLGFDGCVYLLDKGSDEGVLIKYSREGDLIWKKYIPLKEKNCKPCADKNGNVYVLGQDKDNKTKLLKFSPDGDEINIVLNDVLDGGKLSVEDLLAVAPDGMIYAFRFYEVLKVFSPDLSCKFVSKQGMKEDKEKLDNARKKKESEE